jgi:geranylgeranyl reductase family protein
MQDFAKMITIIGAGPVGSYCAKLLAEKGHEVRIFEEHNQIGRPVHCTGIVTKSISETIPLKREWIINKLKRVRVHAPNGKNVEIRIDDIVLDRARFDHRIAESAEKAGTKIFLNSRLESIAKTKAGMKIKIMDTETKKSGTIRTETLIGADGANSLVAKTLGNRTDFWTGVQAIADIEIERDTYEVYFGDEIPGFFGWIVPENETTARIGIATAKNPRKAFDKFIKRFDCKILEMQGGLIPRYDPKRIIHRDGIFAVGDSATQVKATTGGGLVPGLNAAECLAMAIDQKKDYKKELSQVERELKTSLLLRNILDRFNDQDYNELVQILDNKSIKELLNKEDRDKPSRIIFKSIIKQPKLLLFARTLLRAKRL